MKPDLPYEILYKISHELSADDIINLCKSDPSLYMLCRDDKLWRYLINRDFGIKSRDGSPENYNHIKTILSDPTVHFSRAIESGNSYDFDILYPRVEYDEEYLRLAANQSDPYFISRILEGGFNLNGLADALHESVKAGNVEVIRLILDRVDVHNDDIVTSAYLGLVRNKAFIAGDNSVADILSVLNPYSIRLYSIYRMNAEELDIVKRLDRLLNVIDIEYHDDWNDILRKAVFYGDVDVIKFVLERINPNNYDSNEIMRYEINIGDYELVNELLLNDNFIRHLDVGSAYEYALRYDKLMAELIAPLLDM